MKAVEINKTGGTEVLEIKDITLSKPGLNEVTIEQKAIGLNYIDTYHRSGLYPLKMPSGLGLEGAGIITEIGENVKDFKVGDKISYAGIPLGSYSTHRNYPTKNLVKVPDDIDLEVAATLMTKGLTTFYLLHKTFTVKSGQTILFHAAAGGVGQIFGQWAKSLGCTVIGTVGSDGKINIAKENGYDHVINYNKEDFAKKVLEITDGKGVPVVYDGVGKDTLNGSIECLAIRGMMVSFGNASGPLSDINVPKMIQPKGLYLVRPSMQQYLSTNEELEEASKIMFKKISSGKMRFGEIKKVLKTITQQMLSKQLKELEVDGIVNRKVIQIMPPNVEYSLTEFGLSVMPILKSFSEWNKKNTRTISLKLNKNFEESRVR